MAVSVSRRGSFGGGSRGASIIVDTVTDTRTCNRVSPWVLSRAISRLCAGLQPKTVIEYRECVIAGAEEVVEHVC